MAADTDQLSPEDLQTLIATHQHLLQAGDARADKLQKYVLMQADGNPDAAKAANQMTANQQQYNASRLTYLTDPDGNSIQVDKDKAARLLQNQPVAGYASGEYKSGPNQQAGIGSGDYHQTAKNALSNMVAPPGGQEGYNQMAIDNANPSLGGLKRAVVTGAMANPGSQMLASIPAAINTARKTGQNLTNAAAISNQAGEAAKRGDYGQSLQDFAASGAQAIGAGGNAAATLTTPIGGQGLSGAGESFGHGDVGAGLVQTAPYVAPFIAKSIVGAPEAAAYKGTNQQSLSAMRAATGGDYQPATLENMHATAADMGLKPKDFAKGNPQAQANFTAVERQAGVNLAKQYDTAVQSVAPNVEKMPALPKTLVNKMADQYESTQPDLADRIRSGDTTTVGDLEQIRKQIINKQYAGDAVYSAPEQDVLNSFGERLRQKVYGAIAKDGGYDAEELAQLKQIQGNMIQNSQGLASGAKAAGNLNAKLNAGNAAQNFMAKNTGAMAFKGGVGPGVANYLTASGDKAAMIETAMKNMEGAKPFTLTQPTVAPAAAQMQMRSNLKKLGITDEQIDAMYAEQERLKNGQTQSGPASPVNNFSRSTQ